MNIRKPDMKTLDIISVGPQIVGDLPDQTDVGSAFFI